MSSADNSGPVISTVDLWKTYRTGFRRKRIEAVRGVTLSVEPGEIFGFLGPNGAGKTTTIRVLMGLISATSGEAKLFGQELGSREARSRLGFLPEAPYFYDYLTVFEFVDLAGRLFGIDRKARTKRANELIELVGLEHARNTPLKKYSKGMLQRAGIAQALINQPDLVVFDEPMGGLDPVGRKEVRDIILSLRDQGKTVFFSSHILADVESICDRVAILVRGKVHDVGSLSELVQDKVLSTEVTLRVGDDIATESLASLETLAVSCRRRAGSLLLSLAPETDVDALLATARDLGARVENVTSHHETLEDVFIRTAQDDKREATAE